MSRDEFKWLWYHVKEGFFRPVDFVQDKVEKACQWFQKMTGLTNYWILGKECVAIAFTILADFMQHGIGLKPNWFTSTIVLDKQHYIWNAIAGLAMFMWLLTSAYFWKVKEQAAFNRLAIGMANPQKQMKIARYFLLAFCWMDLYLLTVCIYHFLDACDPLPPCQGKVQEWWANRNRKLVPVGQE